MYNCIGVRCAAAVILLFAACSNIAFGAETKASDPNRWEPDIRRFEEWDAKNAWPKDAILFVGSSTIRLWQTHRAFADLPILNRGFGGCTIADVNRYAPRIVLPYRPAAIVFYAGDNDISNGRSPQQVHDDFKQFVGIVRGALSHTRIIFLGIKPSPQRWTLWPKASEANDLIRRFCEQDKHLTFVDLAPCVLGPNGEPDPALFLADRLHFNDAGYARLAAVLKPLLIHSGSPARRQ